MTQSLLLSSTSFSSLRLTLPLLLSFYHLIHIHVADASLLVLPQCQFMRDDTVPKYHLDHACDRAAHNSFGNRALRIQRGREIRSLPTGIQQVPEEKTITCPVGGASVTSLYPPNGVTNANIGLHTSWLVENTSKVPVVLAYVDPKTGREYSAVHSNIAPPHADPQAILMPHQWMSVKTMEGHVFHVYELVERSGGTYDLGRLVLQHRVGLIPVTNKYASPDLVNCGDDPSKIIDEPPIVDKVTQEMEPEFQRSPEIKLERCNVLYRGFRNLVGCPVHAYYIGQSPPPPPTTGDMLCQEDFKFHLGVNKHAFDFEHAWDAPTKFETTFVSHSFVFRLASNTSVMLDAHTFAPVQVIDCPEQEANQFIGNRQVAETVAESVIMPFGDKAQPQQHVASGNTNNRVLVQPKVLKMVIMSSSSSSSNATRYDDATPYSAESNSTSFYSQEQASKYYYSYNSGTIHLNETDAAPQLVRRHRRSQGKHRNYMATAAASRAAGSRIF